MAQDNIPLPPAPQTQANSNQQSNSNSGLIASVILGAIILVLLLFILNQHFNQPSEDSDITEAQKALKEEKERQKNLLLNNLSTSTGQTPEALVNQINTNAETLAGLVRATASDAAMLRSAQDSAAVLGNEVNRLKQQLLQYQAAASEAQRLRSQLQALEQSAAGKVDKFTHDNLRNQLARAVSERDKLQIELNRLRSQQDSMVDQNQFAIIKAENSDLRNQLNELRLRNQQLLDKLNGATLFVSRDRLSPRATALYSALERIEEDDHRSRKNSYLNFNTTLKASVGKTVAFSTGSANLTAEDEATLRNLAANSLDRTFFLVVGYASPSGDSATNETLSSKRATRVASIINSAKKQGQEIQAVYLGEGKRFGPSAAPNQVCEVWQIRP